MCLCVYVFLNTKMLYNLLQKTLLSLYNVTCICFQGWPFGNQSKYWVVNTVPTVTSPIQFPHSRDHCRRGSRKMVRPKRRGSLLWDCVFWKYQKLNPWCLNQHGCLNMTWIRKAPIDMLMWIGEELGVLNLRMPRAGGIVFLSRADLKQEEKQKELLWDMTMISEESLWILKKRKKPDWAYSWTTLNVLSTWL